ncbi:MAG: hypothetical protein AAB439_00480 [Patescibacteria group bacterium]
MKLVGDFLARFQNLTPPHDALKKAVANALSDTIKATVRPESVSIQHMVVFVRTSSIIKNTIQLNRRAILEHIFENMPKARDLIRDIR